MNPNCPYAQTLASLQRLRDDLARSLAGAHDAADRERLRDELGTVHSAVARLNVLADRYEPAVVHEFALVEAVGHDPVPGAVP